MSTKHSLVEAARELVESLDEVCNLPADDHGERIIPAGFLDRAREAMENIPFDEVGRLKNRVADLMIDYQEAIREFVRQKQLACDQLTQDQLADLIIQMIKCGDIHKLVVAQTDAQAMVYVPFRESERLKNRIADLEIALLSIAQCCDHDIMHSTRDIVNIKAMALRPFENEDQKP